MIDQIANMFSKIKNAIMASNIHVIVNNSRMNRSLLDVMKREGYIHSYDVISDNNRTLQIHLKYDVHGIPAIRFLKRVSKLSRRVYAPVNALGFKNHDRSIKMSSRVHKFSTYIVSTSRGVMSDIEAREQGIGGEIMCEVAS